MFIAGKLCVQNKYTRRLVLADVTRIELGVSLFFPFLSGVQEERCEEDISKQLNQVSV